MKAHSSNTYIHLSAPCARTRVARLLGRSTRAFVFAGLLLLPALAAEAADGVVSELSALKQTARTDADGKTVQEYVPFTKVVPGDVLLCTVEYTNKGTAPAGQVVVSLPVPPEMTLVASSAAHQTAETLYSVDGGQSYGPLEKLLITEADGKVRPARADDVNAVRWTLLADLAPGQTGRLSYLATIR
jgi:uncharacterized repeat protein (TIGR01451 family)